MDLNHSKVQEDQLCPHGVFGVWVEVGIDGFIRMAKACPVCRSQCPDFPDGPTIGSSGFTTANLNPAANFPLKSLWT